MRVEFKLRTMMAALSFAHHRMYGTETNWKHMILQKLELSVTENIRANFDKNSQISNKDHIR